MQIALETTNIGDDCHVFDQEPPQPLALDTIDTVEVRRSDDGASLIELVLTVAA